MDEDAEMVGASTRQNTGRPKTPDTVTKALFHKTPSTKRAVYHSSLTERGSRIFASETELQIQAEVRGVTRKDVPLEIFRSTYLCDFNAKIGSKLAVGSVKELGNGSWKEGAVWNRLCKMLSPKVRCPGCALIHSQSSAKLLNRFLVTSTYSALAPRHYSEPTRARRCLPSPISFSTSVKHLLHGQM